MITDIILILCIAIPLAFGYYIGFKLDKYEPWPSGITLRDIEYDEWLDNGGCGCSRKKR